MTYYDIVTKIVRWKQSNKQDNGERRFIYEYSGKHEAQEKRENRTCASYQHIRVTAPSVPLGVYQLTSVHCGQNSKEIQRHSNTLRRRSFSSAPPGFYTFSHMM
ncbi:hypothetical protein AVEN_53383-1 [Araneus ventricosus]|uniref:Uncharacterized protein n=1 Tax=Araneus ventricosus TaxID=182803 RepID=A0A4Y2AA96_ARAVE|nr:hypothetical protein AVEN_53383-1 [Araneus ventricosus]